jgi:hypothetical protein
MVPGGLGALLGMPMAMGVEEGGHARLHDGASQLAAQELLMQQVCMCLSECVYVCL